MEERRPTIDDFLREHPCEMKYERRGRTPHRKGDQFSFVCEIIEHSTGPHHTVRQAVSVEYHMGLGHAKKPNPHLNRPGDVRLNRDGLWERYEYGAGRGWALHVVWPEPELRDVINCLVMDATSIDNGETFVEFAAEMAFDKPTEYEEARRCYDGCHEALAKLRRLFGREETERLMYEVEGL
jgi:hypothetical protein